MVVYTTMFMCMCLMQAFRLRHQQQAAAGCYLNRVDAPRISSAAQQLAARLSPTKDADSQQVGSKQQ